MGAKARWIALLLLWPTVAQAAGLTAWPSLSPPVRNTVPASLMVIKGQSTNSLYAMEVDQTTGALPVEGVGGTPIAVTATQGTTPWIVAGGGTAGTAATGVVTIQGIAGGTAVPISGSITATNAAVGVIGSTAPTSASFGGLLNGSNLIGALGDSSGRTVVAGGGTAGSAAGGVLTVQGSASGTPIPVTANAGTGTYATNLTQVGGSAIALGQTTMSASLPVVLASDQSTITTNQTTAAGTFQDGAIAFGSLTTSYQTVVTTGGVAKIISIRNNTNAVEVVSLNGGSTTSYTLDPSDAISLDLKQAGLNIASSTALQVKYSGSAPTTGNFRMDVAY